MIMPFNFTTFTTSIDQVTGHSRRGIRGSDDKVDLYLGDCCSGIIF